jgi:hypothetical protein
MSLARSRARPLVILLLAVGCAESPPTTIEEDVVAPRDLAFILPALAGERLVQSEGGSQAGTPRPMGVYSEDGWSEDDVVYSDIWNHRTRANFLPGYLSVQASHEQQGNVGRIQTTGTVRHEGQVIGTQLATIERSWPFVIDFGLPHELWLSLRVYTDTECGLTGYGDSVHTAYWHAVIGGPVFDFNRTTRTSQSDHERQPVCEPTTTTFTSTGGGSGGTSSGGTYTCFFWIEYDLWTGEILEAEFLFCTEGG